METHLNNNATERAPSSTRSVHCK